MADLYLGGSVDPASHERTDDDVHIGTDKFTTHGVIVGMTGSGKTGLGVVLIEEVLRAGLPTLLIDPKGDLTNLCLMFPDLAPSDFRPWIDDAQARAAGASPDDFAKQQAELWTKGLGDWKLSGSDIGALKSSTDFTIYTPGSQAGVPINLVGSLQVPGDMSDEEIVSDEIEGYVSGLLSLVGIEADPLSSREHILLSNLIHYAWSQGQSLDLPTLVGMVGTPPIRKLGVFELDQFFPPKDRMAFAMKLNGLLASPSFAAWAAGPPLDIQSLLYTADGKPRCAIVTTAHLSDEERQFVTSLILTKLVTWMRRQSGTTDLRALLYMDEVAGYLPPTANPPTKKPIMTLMKQARAFGIGVVLSTQNPVDVDYKALSNAGTWMIGRLQTDQDKQRLLDGLSSASGGIDVAAIDKTISGLGKREFVLRVAGKDSAGVFTTRWAMSYLRGPLDRDQISELMAGRAPAEAAAAPASTPASTGMGNVAAAAGAAAATVGAAPVVGSDETPVMPEVASGIPVRWVDPASPWVPTAGGDPMGTKLNPVVLARVQVRYDDAKAALDLNQEYECVVTPLAETVDVSRAIAVDYDDRDLREAAPAQPVYRMSRAPLTTKSFFTGIERDLQDHLSRTLKLDIPTNAALKLYGRPGESAEQFAARCEQTASDQSDAEIAALRSKYESRIAKMRDQIAAAEDQIDVLEAQRSSKRNSELLSTAGSILGGLLGGRSKASMLSKLGGVAGRRGQTRASSERVEAAENKVDRLNDDLAELEAEMADDITEIDNKWTDTASQITTVSIAADKSDVKVTQLVLAWLPAS